MPVPFGLDPPELDPPELGTPVDPLDAPDDPVDPLDPPVDAAGAEATLVLELEDVVVLVMLAGGGELVEVGTVSGGVAEVSATGDPPPPPHAATSKDRASPAVRAANDLDRRARLRMVGAALRTRAGPCACRNAGSR